MLVGQVLILRELLVLAQGQELKLALGLWAWLLWTCLGALLGGRRDKPSQVKTANLLTPPPHEGRGLLGWLLTLLGLLLPATILAIRAVPVLAHLPAGQTLPLTTGLLLFFALLAPFCLVSGYFFPRACMVLAAPAPGGAPGRVYSLETLGAALGVLLLQLFFLGHFPDLGLGLGAGLLLAMGPALLGRPWGWLRGGVRLAAVLVLLLGLFRLPTLENLSRGWQFPGRRLAAALDSPYAFLSAAREDGQVSFFVNNLWEFTYPDPNSAEHRVQPALLVHPRPRRVLLLGGGLGLVPEVFKTPGLTRLDYVELDPQMVDLARGLLPAGEWLRDPRLHLVHQDARHFVARTGERYDVILMALPEPRSAQLNRFYTREFFRLVAARLAPGGVFNFSLAGSETSLHPWRAAYLGMIYHTLRQVFPEVLAWPGERVQFFAAAVPGVLTADPARLMARLRARRLHLQYVREYYLQDDLAPARVAFLQRILAQQPSVLNTDLSPGCYFYDLALTGLEQDLPLGRFLMVIKQLPTALLWVLLAVATLILTLILRRRPGALCLYQVMVMGLGTMALEILVLVLYQIQMGSLYRQLGLLIAAFMAGMGGGAAAAGHWLRQASSVADLATRPLERRLAALQGLPAALALVLALGWRHLAVSTWSIPDHLAQGGFALLLAAAGFGGGGIFALSSALWVRARDEAAAKGGRLYAADLLGSTLGALGFGFLILPVWGIGSALFLVAALHGGAALALLGRRTG